MRKIFLQTFIFATLLLILLPTVRVLAADSDYTVLAPLPGIGDSANNGKTNLEKYLPAVFNLAIGISAIFAVLMIVIGGFQYMSSDAIQGKTDGMNRLKNSVYGLVLVIGAWLILNEVNPDLLNVNLNIESVTTAEVAPRGTLGGELSAGTGAIHPGYKLSEAEIEKNDDVVEELDGYGVGVNGGPCINGETSGCTNVVGMNPITFQGVVDLKKVCGNSCNVLITGGTEGGHKSHGPNLNALDLGTDTNLDRYIFDNRIGPPVQSSLGPVYTSRVGNRNATFLRESNPPHWHVVFE